MDGPNDFQQIVGEALESMASQGFTAQPRGSHAIWVVKNDLAWRLHDLLAALSSRAGGEAGELRGTVSPEDRWLWEELGSLVFSTGLERWRIYRALGTPRVVRDVRRSAGGEWEEDSVFDCRRSA